MTKSVTLSEKDICASEQQHGYTKTEHTTELHLFYSEPIP